MKPRFQCTECQTEIFWGDLNCSNCGKPIEWPAGSELEADAAPAGPLSCGNCGSENAPDAAFCSTCGAKLKGQPTRQKSKRSRQESRGTEKESETTPLFSWKMILGAVVVLAIIIVVAVQYSDHTTPPTTQAAAPTQSPAANMQLSSQILELESRVAANPNDLKSLISLANMCQDGRFFDKAITYYKQYLVKNPKDPDARTDLGICYYETNNLEEAQKEMLAVIKDNPKHVAANFNLGIVNLSARRLKEANDWFKKTIELSPNSEMGQKAKQILEQHSSPLIQNK